MEKSDFISDWSNIKALFKSHGSESHVCIFNLNGILIDQLIVVKCTNYLVYNYFTDELFPA